MDLIYLDYNCFQRGFDDPRQVKIQIEALACEEIFKRAEQKVVKLIWSFMHEDENILCPFLERKIEVSRLSTLCRVRVGPDREIYRLAKDFQQQAKLSTKDAVHLACAYFAKRLKLDMKVINPVEYIREVEK